MGAGGPKIPKLLNVVCERPLVGVAKAFTSERCFYFLSVIHCLLKIRINFAQKTNIDTISKKRSFTMLFLSQWHLILRKLRQKLVPNFCFVHPIFSSFGFWYFGHCSCSIFFPFFPSCPSCLAKCKQRLRNIFVT